MPQEEASHCHSHIEFATDAEMPKNRSVIRVERPGEILWLIREGEMTEPLRQEINEILAHVSHHGLQVQRWGGSEPPHTAT
ncbi:hypothetical protein ACWDSL_41035 [Streptomyces sp. NPDC000941]